MPANTSSRGVCLCLYVKVRVPCVQGVCLVVVVGGGGVEGGGGG